MYEILNSGIIELVRGDTAEFDIVVRDKKTEKPYELQSGDELVFTVKRKPTDKVPLISKTGPYIRIDPEDTNGLEFGNYVYDVQLTLDIQPKPKTDTIIPMNTFRLLEEVTW